MSLIARQSTARTLIVGPVLDASGVAVTDGVVADFKISKNGAAPGALNGSATLTHRNTGHYSLALTTSDLDTVGQAEIVIDDTVNACPLRVITVIEPAVYDALFADAATGVLPDTAGVGTLLTRLGTPSNLGGGATVAANLSDIESQTDDIGVAGAGLSAVPDLAGVTTLLSRLSALRAGYLDNLSAGAVALEASLQGLITTIGASAAGVATAVWSAGTRLLTAGTNIVLAKGTGVTGFNDLSAAEVNSEADTALSDIGATSTRMGYLDNLSGGAVALASSLATLAGKFTGITLLAEWLGLIAGKQVGNSTARTELRATGAGSGAYDETTDSQEAIRDRGDGFWATAVGFSTHTAADVWAVGTRTLTSFGTLAADVWASVARTLTAATNITSTGGTTVPQTGDGFARLGAPAGASIAADIATRATPSQVASELATYDGPTKAELDAAVAPLATSSALSTAQTAITAIKAITDALTAAAAAKLAATALGLITGTVGTAGFAPTTTEFEADDITEATADHYLGRIITFTSGALLGQSTDITDYSLATGRGHFTVTALTEAPSNNDTFVIS